MKKTLNTFLILSAIFLIAGAIFKILRYPGGDILTIGALLLTIPVASILYCIGVYKRTKNFLFFLAFIPIIGMSVGFAFMINHYPFGPLLFKIGMTITALYLLLIFILRLINKSFMDGITLPDILVLIVIFGFILAGYATGRKSWPQMTNHELNYITKSKEVQDLNFINQSLYSSYSKDLADFTIRDETEKILYTIDTLQQSFTQFLKIDQDTSQFFLKSFSFETGNFFNSSDNPNRKDLIEESLKAYAKEVSDWARIHFNSTSEKKLLKTVLNFEHTKNFKGLYFAWGGQFFNSPAAILVFLEELKSNILICENILLNSYLRGAPAYPTLDGVYDGNISRYQLNQVKELNCSDTSLRIISYVLVYDNKDQLFMDLAGLSNRLPDNWSDLVKTKLGHELSVQDVDAINTIGDTIRLACIKLQIK